MTGIYKIENLINHKKYIGKSININKRFGEHKRIAFYNNNIEYDYPLYRAIRKYGLINFDFSIIEECEEEKLEEQEKYWIQYYNSYIPNGYNQTLGGDGILKIPRQQVIDLYKSGQSISEIAYNFKTRNQTIKEILHNHNLGYLTQEEKNKLQNPKTVLQFDLSGNFIAEYYSAGEASRKILGKTSPNMILDACNNYHSAHGYLWKYKTDTIDVKQIALKLQAMENQRIQHVSKAILKRCSKPVNQYDLNGKYLKSYSSASEARQLMHNQHICDVCNGKWLTAAKYYWRYTSDEFPENQDLNINEIDQWRRIKNAEANNGKK